MLTILLVDDEEEIREGMARSIPWEELGFSKPVTAENGIDALELADVLRPDIIISDIQMPFMDGLEFIESASKILPTTKFLVFSGYDYFEYAQRAISLKVHSYLLKPFSREELIVVLEKVKQAIEEEKAERLNIERLRQQFNGSISVFRENFLVSCLNGLLDNESIAQKQKEFGFLEQVNFRLILFEIHESPLTIELTNRSLLLIAEKDIAFEKIEGIEEPILFFYGDYLVWLSMKATDNQILQLTNDICATMASLNSLTLAGISQRHVTFSELKNMCLEAQSALDFSSHLDQQLSFAMLAEDIPHQNMLTFLNVSKVESRKLENLLKYGDKEKLNHFAIQLFEHAQERKLNRFEYTAFLSEWVGVLSRACFSNETEAAHQLLFRLTEEMASKVGLSFDEGYRWFKDCCYQVSSILQQEIQQSSKGMVMQSLHYISENFKEPGLTAESLSQYLHLNPAYFSVWFKKHTGETFVNYLTKKRVEEAKILLENTEDKTYIIAEQVGYTEANYFSYVFKKATGLSPTKYRKTFASKELL